MSKKMMQAGVLAVLGLVAGGALAQSGVYVRGDLGYAWADGAGARNVRSTAIPQLVGTVDGMKDSSIYGVGIGYRYNPNLRVDFTLAHRGDFRLEGNDSAVAPAITYNADVKSTAYMFNGYWDFKDASRSFTPFVGLGIGWSENKTSSLRYVQPGAALAGQGPGGKKNDFAWQFTAGVSFDISKQLSVEAAYRFMDLGNFKTNPGVNSGTVAGVPWSATVDGVEGKLRSNELNVGVRYGF